LRHARSSPLHLVIVSKDFKFIKSGTKEVKNLHGLITYDGEDFYNELAKQLNTPVEKIAISYIKNGVKTKLRNRNSYASFNHPADNTFTYCILTDFR
jgi:hypothetical protein